MELMELMVLQVILGQQVQELHLAELLVNTLQKLMAQIIIHNGQPFLVAVV
jgi:hypothetical protein